MCKYHYAALSKSTIGMRVFKASHEGYILSQSKKRQASNSLYNWLFVTYLPHAFTRITTKYDHLYFKGNYLMYVNSLIQLMKIQIYQITAQSTVFSAVLINYHEGRIRWFIFSYFNLSWKRNMHSIISILDYSKIRQIELSYLRYHSV